MKTNKFLLIAALAMLMPVASYSWSPEFGGMFDAKDKEIDFTGTITASGTNKITKVTLTAGGLKSVFSSVKSSVFKDNPQAMDAATFTLTGVSADIKQICGTSTGSKNVDITAAVQFKDNSILLSKKTVAVTCEGTGQAAANAPSWSTEFSGTFDAKDKEIDFTGVVTANGSNTIKKVTLTASGLTSIFSSVKSSIFKDNPQIMDVTTFNLTGVSADIKQICGTSTGPKDVDITAAAQFKDGSILLDKKTVTVKCN